VRVGEAVKAGLLGIVPPATAQQIAGTEVAFARRRVRETFPLNRHNAGTKMVIRPLILGMS
jgi:hypothetical protein